MTYVMSGNVLRRAVGLMSAAVAVTLALALLTSPGAFAAEPPGANGYQSAIALAEKQKEAVNDGLAAPGNLRGVPNPKPEQRQAGAQVTSALSGVKPYSTVGWECGPEGFIQSRANGLYVSTELGYLGEEKGMLRARSSSVGAWELYQICSPAGSGTPRAIWSDGAAKFVSTELGDTGPKWAMLRARANSVGPWEEYVFLGKSLIYGVSERWVSAELGDTGSWYGMLRARAESIGPWEEWEVQYG